MAVVVLPTPPFWLAIASTRGRGAGSVCTGGFSKGTTWGAFASGADGSAVSVMLSCLHVIFGFAGCPQVRSGPRMREFRSGKPCELGPAPRAAELSILLPYVASAGRKLRTTTMQPSGLVLLGTFEA